MGAGRVAVVGAGWAGLAAAVRARQAGHAVTLIEMAHHPGGRARSIESPAGEAAAGRNDALDNGQHILIGAYTRTLDLMRTVGCDISALLHRQPLEIRYPDGRGLRMAGGPAWWGFVRAVMGCKGWTVNDRVRLLSAAARWAAAGFTCAPHLTVDDLCAALPSAVRSLLIDPLCVAALNTPAGQASAAVLLRVLRDALLSGPGSADLLLPREPLGSLLPEPATRWLRDAGVALQFGHRVLSLDRLETGWACDGQFFDAVVLACSAAESARLVSALAPTWAGRAAALPYEPIVTVYLQALGTRLPMPMTALVEGPREPAQFVFDHGAMGGQPGRFAFVVSGAGAWVEAGLQATAQAVIDQAMRAFPHGTWNGQPTLERVLATRRATFRCTPGLDRPPHRILPGLMAAGDYVEGPYPATLEGAVRSGEIAAGQLG